MYLKLMLYIHCIPSIEPLTTKLHAYRFQTFPVFTTFINNHKLSPFRHIFFLFLVTSIILNISIDQPQWNVNNDLNDKSSRFVHKKWKKTTDGIWKH